MITEFAKSISINNRNYIIQYYRSGYNKFQFPEKEGQKYWVVTGIEESTQIKEFSSIGENLTQTLGEVFLQILNR